VTVRRVTPSTPAGPFQCLAEIYITSKAIKEKPNKPEYEGRNKRQYAWGDEAKGTVKEKAGQVTNNPKLTDEGQSEKVAGKVQKKVGQIERVLEK
jgi:uncharacterized protein YjbJ (UPF0337 family)